MSSLRDGLTLLCAPGALAGVQMAIAPVLQGFGTALILESISNRGLRGVLLNLRLLFNLHSRIPTNEGLQEVVIEYLRAHLE